MDVVLMFGEFHNLVGRLIMSCQSWMVPVSPPGEDRYKGAPANEKALKNARYLVSLRYAKWRGIS
jgi:hypothetical protein